VALDVTVAGAAANSYLSVADADAFAASDVGPARDKWLTATLDEKERALIRATADIDGFVARVAHPFVVNPPYQALLFPRAEDVLSGVAYITRAVQMGTYVQAAFLNNEGARLLEDSAKFRARGLSNFSNPDGTGGSVATNADDGVIHPRVARLLGEYTGGAIIGTIVTT
jgi:hypothetical protein